MVHVAPDDRQIASLKEGLPAPDFIGSRWSRALQVMFDWNPTGLSSMPSKAIWLDAVERSIAILMFGPFVVRMVSGFQETDNIVALLSILSELLPVALILTRRLSISVSTKPLDWTLGIAGASAPLLTITTDANPLAPELLCVLLMVAGMLVQLSAKVALGRSFGIVSANRGVKNGGPYRCVRHPMYVGYTITHIGFLLAFPSLQNALLYLTTLIIQIARLLREERLLMADPAYQAFAARVRYRLVPGLF
jgi:protein-S-isoprenylcysteine O-methyltransferase Ste14